MRPRIFALLVFCLALAGLPLQAQQDKSPHSQATLIAETTAIEPGAPFTVALRLQMDKGWHSYWRNPGDSGLETKIQWKLPPGFKAGEIQWPYPQRLIVPPLVSYGYENEVWLLTQITPPADLPDGQNVTLRAQADWLVCEQVCLPAEAELSLQLPVRKGAPALDARWKDAFARARAQLPVPAAQLGYTVGVERAPGDNGGFVLSFRPPAQKAFPAGLQDTHFFAGEAATLDLAAPQKVTRAGDAFQIKLSPSEYAEKPAERLRGVLLAPEGQFWDDKGTVRALWIDVPVGAAPAASTALSGATASGSSTSLGLALLLAFAGGLLLNLMPCVFPVLSLKVLGFVQQAGEERGKVARHGLAFGAGVLLSFWALAGVLLALRAAGGGVGWGFQLQSPVFVAGLAILIFGVGLNLLGAFDVGAGLTRLGGATSQARGYGGSFASGILATVVATPCTAPFMGAALGYALAQPPIVAMSVFTALGVGMALPYVLLSFNPALIRRLPRPGAWMETLKQFMAFPMFATALWLAWVFGLQTGVNGLSALLAAFLLCGFAAWIVHHWKEAASRPARVLARALACLAVVLALWLAGRGAMAAPPENSAPETAQRTAWQPFSAEKVAALRAAGQPVFVDFTAAWCITCQVNKRTTLAQPEVLDAFKERGVTLMRADWTRRDPEITRVLQSYGRSGVPVYALYSGTGESSSTEELPTFLPEVLSAPIVLNALQAVPLRSENSTRQAAR